MQNTQNTSRLAIYGGNPAISNPIPPMYPGGMSIDSEEEQAVLEVIRSRRLFRYYGPKPGPSKVAELEHDFASHIGTKFALAVTSGTAALITALVGLGIGPGDEVIVPAYTWIATASAVFAVGAIPIIAEVDDSLTLDPSDIEPRLSPFTRAIIPVHMRGAPCRMDAILHIAQQHNLAVIEDTAQATGASYMGKRLGSWGDAGAYSLQFNKIITSGEGGMLVTNREDVYQRAVMTHDVVGGQRNQVPNEQIIPGINYRLSELQGAVALVQLHRLDSLLEAMRLRKRFIKDSLQDIANKKGITFRSINDPAGEAAIAIIFTLPSAAIAQSITECLRAEGLPAMVLYSPDIPDYHIYPHWIPIMQQRSWSATGFPWKTHPRKIEYHLDMCPRSLDLLSRSVHIDVHPALSNSQMEEISDAIHKVLHSTL